MINIYKAHPWHGIDPGNDPALVTAFIEIVTADTIKYEIDKVSGYLSIDRPQKFSNVVPSLYGFIPRTYCGEKIAEYDAEKSGRSLGRGDGDPLDICVLCEHTVVHGDILLKAIPIGGIRMMDKGENDDKIIAVLKGDEVYASWTDMEHVPEAVVSRLKHYFLTYKNIPGKEPAAVEIINVFGKEEALEVIKKSKQDYRLKFGKPELHGNTVGFNHKTG
jgi:inorganic pyrophosphatase